MSEFVLDEEASPIDWYGPSASTVPPASSAPLPGLGAPWLPPAQRDHSHDAQLFSAYADGPISIPGLDEGFAAMRKTEAIFNAALTQRAEIKEGTRRRRQARWECLLREEEMARMNCEDGLLPTGARPAAMTDEECLAHYRDNSDPVIDTEALRDDVTAHHSYADKGKQTLKGGGTVFGVGVEGTGEATQEDTQGGGSLKSIIRERKVHRPGRRGYVARCQEESTGNGTGT